MKKNRFFAFIFLLGTFFSVNGFSQLLPPNQPEQDACNALILCGTSFTSPYGYQGVGLVNDLTATPCAGGEGNTMWLRLNVNTPGIIVFTIAPITVTDDYDMAVINMTNTTCNALSSANVIRCNFNNNLPTYNNGILGLNTTSTIQYVTAGTTGNSYLQQITASAGDVYLIMINNFGTGFSGPVSGFTIDFTGSTATFNQPPAPKFAGLVPACNLSHEVTLQLSDYILCSSLALDGSDFSLTPSGTIQSVLGTNCTGTAGYTDKIKITFNGNLPNGNYTLHAQTGTDMNTLLGLCNSELQLPDSVNFHVGIDPIDIMSIDSPACQFMTIHLNSPVLCNTIATNGSDFEISGPSNVSVASASAVGCTSGFTQTVLVNLAGPIAVDGPYQLKVKVGSDANTMLDTCGRVVPVGASIGFNINSFNGILTALPDTSVCNSAATINLYGVNNGTPPSTGFQYHWSPTTGLLTPNNLNTQATIQSIVSHFTLATVDVNGCYLRDSNTVYVQPIDAKLQPKNTIACFNNPTPLLASGGTQYQWFDNPQLSGVPSSLNCNLCPNPNANPPIGDNTYFVIVKNDIGCADTLQSKITVRPIPFLDVHPKDTLIKYGESVQLHASGASTFAWYPMGTLNNPYIGDPIATPRETTQYIVTGADEYGCLGYDTALVRIDFRSPVFIPNSFTPNGDGLNDVFSIGNLKYQKVLAFKIFDRWGHLVFETTDSKKGWDGKIKDKIAPVGVYIYYIELGYADNYTEVFKGNLTLLR